MMRIKVLVFDVVVGLEFLEFGNMVCLFIMDSDLVLVSLLSNLSFVSGC